MKVLLYMSLVNLANLEAKMLLSLSSHLVEYILHVLAAAPHGVAAGSTGRQPYQQPVHTRRKNGKSTKP